MSSNAAAENLFEIPNAGIAGLGVVILSYAANPTRWEKLLPMLEQEGIDPSDCVVVQNPVEHRDPLTETHASGAEIIFTARNLGYGPAINIGVRHQLGRGVRDLLIASDDVEPRPGAVVRLCQTAAAAPEYAVLGVTLWDRVSDQLFSRGGVVDSHNATHVLLASPPANEVGIFDCAWVDAALWLIRGDAFKELTLLDERFWMYGEEPEFCLRASRAGWKVGTVIDAVADQSPGSASRLGAFEYLNTRNGLEYVRRHFGWRGVVNRLRRHVRDSRHPARVCLALSADPAAKSHCQVLLRGRWSGVRDFLLARWGPPPKAVQGATDIKGT